MKHHAPYLVGILLCVLLPMLYFVPACGASPVAEEHRELWTGRMYSSTYRAGICIKSNGEVYGALFLRQASGAVDRYTLSGKVDGKRISVRHSSGHVFQGVFTSKNTVEGELVLKNGHKMRVRALRGPEPEVDESCRLLQQE